MTRRDPPARWIDEPGHDPEVRAAASLIEQARDVSQPASARRAVWNRMKEPRASRSPAVAWVVAAVAVAAIAIAFVIRPRPEIGFAEIASVEGDVESHVVAAAAPERATVGLALKSGGRVKTSRGARSTVRLHRIGTIAIAPYSDLSVNGDGERVGVQLEAGTIVATVAPREGRPPFAIEAGPWTVRVVGTVFKVVRVDVDDVEVEVEHGVVDVRGPNMQVLLRAGDRFSSRDMLVRADSKPTTQGHGSRAAATGAEPRPGVADRTNAVGPDTADRPESELHGAAAAAVVRRDEVDDLSATERDAVAHDDTTDLSGRSARSIDEARAAGPHVKRDDDRGRVAPIEGVTPSASPLPTPRAQPSDGGGGVGSRERTARSARAPRTDSSPRTGRRSSAVDSATRLAPSPDSRRSDRSRRGADRAKKHDAAGRPIATNGNAVGDAVGNAGRREAKKHDDAGRPIATNGDAAGDAARRDESKHDAAGRPLATAGNAAGDTARREASSHDAAGRPSGTERSLASNPGEAATGLDARAPDSASGTASADGTATGLATSRPASDVSKAAAAALNPSHPAPMTPPTAPAERGSPQSRSAPPPRATASRPIEVPQPVLTPSPRTERTVDVPRAKRDTDADRYQAAVGARDPKGAIAQLDLLAKSDGAYAEIAGHRAARIALSLSRWSEAAERYQALRAKHPRGSYDREARIGLIEARVRGGDVGGARREADAFVVAYPKSERSSELQFLRAEIARQSGQCGEAVDMYASAERSRRRGDALYFKAWCLIELGDDDAGRTALQDYLRAFPGGRHAKRARKGLTQ